MVYRFILVSDEENEFMREILIDSEAKFTELHDTILKSVGYSNDAITSFFICSDEWEKEQEITLLEMDTRSDIDNYTMDETCLEELIEDENQKVLYVFDNFSDRAFFMELKEIIPGESLAAAEISAQLGDAPAQYKFEENPATTVNKNNDFFADDDIFSEEAYDDEDIDNENFRQIDENDDFFN